MSEVEWIRKWYDYNAFVRQRYLETLSKLPPEELTRDRGASFPTLLDIFAHSLGGTETWIVRMSALNSKPFKPFDGPDDLSLDDIRQYDKSVQEQVIRFFSRLTDRDLDRTYLVPKLPPWWDEDFTTSIRSTLLHVIEHELQHRGELNALLWQINVEPPITNWRDFGQMHTDPSSAKE
ncbi:MAG: DinB family protein [Thermoplasmata archaeon]|nr:DinB family protein [Candidatus Sysuiplasma acidicola]MBX8645688.1 DinB family protein [Candidatus Sysuiplasma acidicola]